MIICNKTISDTVTTGNYQHEANSPGSSEQTSQRIGGYFKDLSESHPLQHLPKKPPSLSKNSFLCRFCDKSFSKQLELDAHTMKVHGKIKRSVKLSKASSSFHRCCICYSTFHTKEGLRIHNKIQHKIRDEPVNDAEVNDAESSILSECPESEEATFTCDHCGQLFANKYLLRLHLQGNCGQLGFHKCTQCDKLYKTDDALSTHVFLAHSSRALDSCSSADPQLDKSEQIVDILRAEQNRTKDQNFADPGMFKFHLL